MNVNKVISFGKTLIDLTGDTVTADKLVKGATAHDASGAQIVGTFEGAVVNLQSKSVTPTLEQQIITYDPEYTGLDNVVVFAIPQSILDAEYQKGYDDAISSIKPYKKELAYIEVSGTQYIRTSFVIDATKITTYKVVADIAILSTSGWAANGSSASQPCFYLGANVSSGYFAYGNGSKDVVTTIPFNTQRHTITLDAKNGAFIVDSEEHRGTFQNTSANRSFAIGGYATSETTAVCHAERIWGYKFYENDTLVGDYIPVLDLNDIPCMFDRVGGELYYNAGTGEITYSEDDVVNYTVVNYIESDGAQYINTLFNANQDTRVVIDVDLTNSQGLSFPAIFATDSSGSKAYRFTTMIYTGQNGFHDHFGNQVVNSSNINVYSRHVIDKNKNVTYLDGSAVSTFNYTSFQSVVPLVLLASHENGVYQYFAKAKIYSCKVYDNGTLIRDYIPVLDLNGVPCLYDLVNEQFYHNAGSGTFAYG